MKKITTLLLFLFAFTGLTQTSFKLYDVKFRASEILGSGAFKVCETDHQTEYLGNEKVTNDLYDILGQYYSTQKFTSTTNLLNKYSAVSQPILDEINLRFYRENAFELIATKNATLFSTPGLTAFKRQFDSLYDAGNIVEARKLVYKDGNRLYRLALELTRYDKATDKTFKLSKDQQSGLTLGLSADITSKIIGKKVQLDAKLKAKLQDSIKKHIEFNDARYVEIGLQKDYITIASIVIKKYNNNKPVLDGMTDVFAEDLRTFLKSDNTAIITGADVLCISLNYTKYKSIIASIGATLKANTTTEPANILSINSDIDAMFNTNTGREFAMTNGVTYYNLRYGYHNKLEIGAIKQ